MIDRYCFVIGAMKAGTTSLFDHLSKHPEVAVANPKEAGFFAFDSVYSNGFDWYEGLFSFDPANHKVAVEGTTDYSKFPHAEAAPRIRAFAETRDVKLIYIMRHPLRRIESHARHTQAKRAELGRTISDRADHSLDAGVSSLSLDASRYAMQIDQYQDFLVKDRLRLFTLERLQREPVAVVEEICEYLEISSTVISADVKQKNKAPGVRYNDELNLAWRIAASIAPLKAAVKAVTPGEWRHKMRRKARTSEPLNGRFKLTPAEEAALLSELAPDLLTLSSQFGIDIKAEWNIDPKALRAAA
ncbi:MAG: sulfotransferase domain-containing protein [Pseudomonadota bacterium]